MLGPCKSQIIKHAAEAAKSNEFQISTRTEKKIDEQ